MYHDVIRFKFFHYCQGVHKETELTASAREKKKYNTSTIYAFKPISTVTSIVCRVACIT